MLLLSVSTLVHLFQYDLSNKKGGLRTLKQSVLLAVPTLQDITSLKEKRGAEMAPGWSRFHVHRMAPI